MVFDPSKIFNGNDDLFKFLLVGGAFMIVFSFIYPLEQAKELKLEIIEYNGNIESLELGIRTMNDLYEEAKMELAQITDSLETYKVQNQDLPDDLRARGNELIQKVKSEENNLEHEIILKNIGKEKVETLIEYCELYNKYSTGMLVCGICFASLGILFWAYSQYLTLNNKYYNNKILKKDFKQKNR